jgi:aminoacyl tRNA synthase complex-interacting multifunctional protein 1
LVPYYSLEDMQDRKLIVVANLLPRKLVGFKSFGMVLCASSTGEDGKERVEFIDPPLSSMPGTVFFIVVTTIMSWWRWIDITFRTIGREYIP